MHILPKHKKQGMIDIKNKRCNEENCNKLPIFNFKEQKNPLYCSKHKKNNMIDMIHKSCIEENCKTFPSFNFKGLKKGLYCSEHKKKDMINILKTPCINSGCMTRPQFNFINQKIPLYCSIHKKNNMINIISKKCLETNCEKTPCFNFKSLKKGLFCEQHKKENMINVKDKKCIEPNCITRANFNIETKKIPIYCSIHKKDNMVNIKSKKCKTPHCLIQVSNKYEGYCLFCFSNTFPDKPISKNYKTKELEVVEYITKTFPQYTWITDKKVQDGCSKRRPDLLLDMGDQVIIIEIDENQHLDYDCSCENKRLMEISQDLSHRPIIFIRFNPDEYYIENKKIQSCFGYDTKGMCKLKPKYIKEWQTRLNTIKETILYWTENKTNKTIEIIQLYFDNFII